MKLGRRVAKLEALMIPKNVRRYVVLYKNPQTGVLEPTDAIIDENTDVMIIEYVESPYRDADRDFSLIDRSPT